MNVRETLPQIAEVGSEKGRALTKRSGTTEAPLQRGEKRCLCSGREEMVSFLLLVGTLKRRRREMGLCC